MLRLSSHGLRALPASSCWLLLAFGCSTPTGVATPAYVAPQNPNQPPTVTEQLCAEPSPVPQRLWRLSNAQYSNAVRDLLGLTMGPLVTGGGQSAFSFYSADTETVSDALAFSYATAAESVAASVDMATLASCTPGEGQPDCAIRFIRALAPRAFRRPVSELEVADLQAVYQAGIPEGHEAGLRLVVEAMLNAPSFVYRTEFGSMVEPGRADLGAYEVASELSFLFFDSAPDAALLSAAETGELLGPGGLATQVDRLLALPEVQRNLTRVVLDWFGAPQVLSKSKADPAFDEALKSDLVTESRTFVQDQLWARGGAIGQLLTSQRTFVNSRLAVFYGLVVPAATETNFAAVELPPCQRAGILTHASVMAMHADVEETSVVLRGKFVRDDVLCLPPLPPPPAIASDPEIVAALAAAQTERARAQYRASNALCNSCHAGLDPLGLTFEHFDAAGRYRVEAHGQPVDASAEFSMAGLGESSALTGRIDGAHDLAQRIAAGGTAFVGCAVEKLTSYAVGRPIQNRGDAAVVCQLEAIERALPSEVTIQALLRGVALSPMFRTRRIAGGS